TFPEGNGLKQRLRWAFADPGELPVDVNLYGEVVENQRAVELEAKLILQRRLGNLRLVANMTGELELYYDGRTDVEIFATTGATVEVTPAFHLGLEAWLRDEEPTDKIEPRPFALGPHVYAGPTVLLNFGKVWWSVGAYLRVTDFEHTMAPGEPFGAFWARS